MGDPEDTSIVAEPATEDIIVQSDQDYIDAELVGEQPAFTDDVMNTGIAEPILDTPS